MSVAAISPPKGIVPRINFEIENMLTQGYRIHHITFDMMGMTTPLVQEIEKLAYHTCECKFKTKLSNSDKNLHVENITLLFQQWTGALLKMGRFAALICKITIKATRDQNNGTPKNLTKKITAQMAGDPTSKRWEKNLFSTVPLSHHRQTTSSNTLPAKK